MLSVLSAAASRLPSKVHQVRCLRVISGSGSLRCTHAGVQEQCTAYEYVEQRQGWQAEQKHLNKELDKHAKQAAKVQCNCNVFCQCLSHITMMSCAGALQALGICSNIPHAGRLLHTHCCLLAPYSNCKYDKQVSTNFTMEV